MRRSTSKYLSQGKRQEHVHWARALQVELVATKVRRDTLYGQVLHGVPPLGNIAHQWVSTPQDGEEDIAGDKDPLYSRQHLLSLVRCGPFHLAVATPVRGTAGESKAGHFVREGRLTNT